MDSKGQKQKAHCFGSDDDLGSFPENKSKRLRTDESENEVEEFFTLVDRIHALNKLCKKKRMNSASVLFMEEIVGSDGKPPWKPVFQQEDFCELPSKGSPSAQKDPTSSINKIAVVSGVCEKESTGSRNLMGMKIFDLNVEATSDQLANEELMLFS